MINQFFFISLFSITHNMLFCMENKNVVFNLVDGQVSLQHDKAEKLPFVMPNSTITQVDLTKVRSSLTKELFTLLTNDKFKIPENLSFEKTFKLWKEADFFCALDDDQEKALIKQAKKKATTIGDFVDLQDSHIPRKKDYYEYDEDGFRTLTIGHNRKLTSIEGIEKLSYLQPDLLWMHSNSLRSINLDHILKHFPKVQSIYLGNNKLSQIHATHLPSNFTLSIQNNRLSNEQIKKLQALVAPLPWYKKVYNASFIQDKDFTLLRTIGACLAYSIPSALIGDYAADKMANKFQLDDHVQELIFLATALPLALGLVFFDFFRGFSPYEPAKIIGADDQRRDNEY